MIELILISQLALTNNLLLGTYSIAAATDIATTQYGLGRDIIHEANPVQRYFTDRGPVWSGVAKGSMHTGIGWILLRHKKEHPKLIFWSLVILDSAQIFVDTSNARTIGRAKTKH